MISALQLDRRFARAAQALAYVIAAVPIAVLAVPVVLALVLGATLSLVAVGVPLLQAASSLCRRLVGLDRRAANRFLGTQIPPIPAGARIAGSPWRGGFELLSDRSLWRTAVQLATTSLAVVAALIIVAIPSLALVAIAGLGLEGVAGGQPIEYLGPWSFGPAVGLLLCAVAIPAGALVLAALDALHGMLRAIAGRVFVSRTATGGPVREMLAESLGDSSVSVAYWLPERSGFVDEVGRPVELPGPGSGRAWTAVERGGQRVAAIIHDAALDTSRELVQAAAAASSLAIDNERLKADLRARLEELRVSRLRIVEAGDAARRRIERDLHDGAQQRLVSVALQLRLLKSQLHDPQIGRLVDELSEQLAAALAELRELARGIHPAILSDRGLAPALDALAGRMPVPLVSRVAIEGRLPAAVEAAVYFLVAEALTNVARYAHASSARVDVRRDGDEVIVVIADDGVGGVDRNAGSGLRGLQDRLAALDGTLAIDSPRGGGTRLEARIPCPAGQVRVPPPEMVG